MKQGRWLLILTVLLGLSVLVYAFMGGFEKPQIQQVQLPSYLLAGKNYEGEATDKALGKAFEEVENWYQQAGKPGELAAVYYKTLGKDKERNATKAFIGVIVKDSSLKLPAGFSYRRLPGGLGLRAILAPKHIRIAPDQVQKALNDYALSQKRSLQDFVIEHYPENQQFKMEILLMP
jgi:hypothetical protein